MRSRQSTRSLEQVIWITVAGGRARGYPKTGFLNALLTENVSAAHANTGEEIHSDHPTRRRRGGGAHHRSGDPGGLIGGMMGGLFGHR